MGQDPVLDSPSNCLPLGAVASRFGVPVWKVRRLYERGLLPPAERVGNFRVVRLSDLPVIELALRRAGYLPGPACSGSVCSGAPANPGTGTAAEITDGHTN